VAGCVNGLGVTIYSLKGVDPKTGGSSTKVTVAKWLRRARASVSVDLVSMTAEPSPGEGSTRQLVDSKRVAGVCI